MRDVVPAHEYERYRYRMTNTTLDRRWYRCRPAGRMYESEVNNLVDDESVSVKLPIGKPRIMREVGAAIAAFSR